MFILLILLICLSHLVNTQANGSLQMLFLCLKMTTVNSKRITVLFLCSQVFPRSVKELCSFTNNFLMEIGFLYKFQSGFRPGDSTINQLIFLVHKIYEALEGGKEVRVVFLDISKAFDKVWHAGLLRKLEALGIQSPSLQWFESHLCNRKQRVVIEGQCCDCRSINSGVPKGLC